MNNKPEKRAEPKPIYERLCPNCASKLEAINYSVVEMTDVPLKHCPCNLAWDGHGGYLALYKVKKIQPRYRRQSGGGERARAGGGG